MMKRTVDSTGNTISKDGLLESRSKFLMSREKADEYFKGKLNVSLLGQVFTNYGVVKKMINLINKGKNSMILEPASGNGMIYNELLKQNFTNVSAIEIDKKVAHNEAIIMDFFDLDINNKFDVVIGNPPYIEAKHVPKYVHEQLAIGFVNMYMHFIKKSLDHLNKNGELIFIMPTNWLVSTRFKSVIRDIYANYSIVHFEVMQENIWDNAQLTTAIFKIVKHPDSPNKLDYFLSNAGFILFGKKPLIETNVKWTIKVGAASGDNQKFFNTNIWDEKFIISSTERTKKLACAQYHSVLDQWIRKLPKPPKFTYQIFVNTKTRNKKPFYMLKQNKGDLIYYDSSVLCIYCEGSKNEINELLKRLNELNWQKMGIYKNGKYTFTNKIVEGVLEKEKYHGKN